MTGYSNSPRILKGGIVLLDAESGQVLRIISLQYNPEKMTRSMQVQAAGGESGNRSEAMRFKGPAIETFKLEADIDAADQLEFPDQHRSVVENGVQPQVAILESLVNPTSGQLFDRNSMSQSGMLEIAPMEEPLTLFVWGKNRIVPVRVTDFSVTEEAFDPSLNPILAKVSIGMRVLSVDDLGFAHKGGSLFMSYLQAKERLASKAQAGSFSSLGIGGI
jgi:hypothetical protein